ncbi:hypothetical protein KHP62_13535 [Rhodobacteraceae bacterium NNCM2]|nr:hypothetical protein [Coraliihabitans acroporae]
MSSTERYLFTGQRYAARHVLPDAEVTSALGIPADAPVVVTFWHAAAPVGLDGSGYGQGFFERRGIEAVHILNDRVDWFQHDEILDCLAAIRRELGPDRRIIAYGASMGGYGAILSSGPLVADKVLAIAPQFSIDRAVVPFERRWRVEAEEIGPFVHDITQLMREDAEVFVLYDPRSVDRLQFELFPRGDGWHELALPFSGHLPAMALQEAGLLSRLILEIWRGDLDLASFRCEMMERRRVSSTYWRTICLTALRLRHMQVAQHARDRFRASGGHPRIAETLDQRIDEAPERWARLDGIAAERAARQARLRESVERAERIKAKVRREAEERQAARHARSPQKHEECNE